MRMGARIVGIGTNKIVIDGVERLKGIEHTLLNDHMEVGSLIATTAMTHGEVTIRDAVPQHLRMTLLVFKRLGIDTEVRGDDIFVPAKERYVVEPDLGDAIPTLKPQVWPGFPTDLTSIATAFATQADGVVLIHEWMFEGRLFFVDTLTREMGAHIVLADPHRAVVMGPSKLRAAKSGGRRGRRSSADGTSFPHAGDRLLDRCASVRKSYHLSRSGEHPRTRRGRHRHQRSISRLKRFSDRVTIQFTATERH